jgi:hypothetical protein
LEGRVSFPRGVSAWSLAARLEARHNIRPESLSQFRDGYAGSDIRIPVATELNKGVSSSMPDNPDPKENSKSSKNIQIPPIPKQTAGAVVGAATGSIAGPIGAVVGGVVGAVAGKAAEKRRPIVPAARRTVRKIVKSSEAISRTSRRRPPSKKSVAQSRKSRARSRGKAKKRVSRRSTTTKSRKGAGIRGRSTSSRVTRKRSGGRSKRH